MTVLPLKITLPLFSRVRLSTFIRVPKKKERESSNYEEGVKKKKEKLYLDVAACWFFEKRHGRRTTSGIKQPKILSRSKRRQSSRHNPNEFYGRQKKRDGGFTIFSPHFEYLDVSPQNGRERKKKKSRGRSWSVLYTDLTGE